MELLTAEYGEPVNMREVGDKHVGQALAEPTEIRPGALILEIHHGQRLSTRHLGKSEFQTRRDIAAEQRPAGQGHPCDCGYSQKEQCQPGTGHPEADAYWRRTNFCRQQVRSIRVNLRIERLLLGNGRNEPIANFVEGLYESSYLGVVAQCPSNLFNALNHGIVSDGRSLPEVFNQLLFA